MMKEKKMVMRNLKKEGFRRDNDDEDGDGDEEFPWLC